MPSGGNSIATTALSTHVTTTSSAGVTDSPPHHFGTYHTAGRRWVDAKSTRCSCTDWLAQTYRQLWTADAAMPDNQPVRSDIVPVPVNTPAWYFSISDESTRTTYTVSLRQQMPITRLLLRAKVCCGSADSCRRCHHDRPLHLSYTHDGLCHQGHHGVG